MGTRVWVRDSVGRRDDDVIGFCRSILSRLRSLGAIASTRRRKIMNNRVTCMHGALSIMMMSLFFFFFFSFPFMLLRLHQVTET